MEENPAVVSQQEKNIPEHSEKVTSGEKKDVKSKNGVSAWKTEADVEETAEVEEIISEEIKRQKQDEALEFKELGNKEFKEKNWEAAGDLYTKGIKACPKCYTKTISVLHGNRGACSAQMDMLEPAIKDCTSALEYDAYYTRARLRRAQLYEKTDKLEEALKDYNEILAYDRSCTTAGEAALRLPKQINERNEKMKEEMFSKLKDLGNTCLKPFGLSTDNFKVVQQGADGGYSINFQR